MDEAFLPVWTSNPKNLPKRPSKPQSPSKSASSFLPEQARLKDLCAEDKARIGELVKKLAIEKNQREELESKTAAERKQQAKQVKKLKKANKLLTQERDQLKEEMNKMLEVLDSYKKLGLSNKKPFNPADSVIQASEFFIKSQDSLEDTQDFRGKTASPPPSSPLKNQPNSSSLKNQSNSSLRNQSNSPMQTGKPPSPVKVNSLSTQTACDKEIQSEEFPPQKPSAINEIKNLRSDLSSLTQSMKSFSNSYSNSLRASQLNCEPVHKQAFEPLKSNGEEEDRVKQLLKRVEKSTERAQTLMEFRPEPAVQVLNEDVPIVEDRFYNECLFDLVDDLEQIDNSMSQVKSFDIGNNVIGMIEELEKDDFSINDLAEDSFEALRARAYRVKQSVKY